MAADRAVELLLKTCSAYFEQGDKAGRMLAHQLQQTISSHQIPEIATSSGTTIDPEKINDEFRAYYASLYASETNAGKHDFDGFFSRLKIPPDNLDMADQLETPITALELSGALKTMQSGKCPGPDGFRVPVEFYRCFQNKQDPVLIHMFNESFLTGKLPSTPNQASISLILKKDKDPLSCSSYRPISLLNVDIKILETVLPGIISPDQRGFVKNRHSFFTLLFIVQRAKGAL